MFWLHVVEILSRQLLVKYNFIVLLTGYMNTLGDKFLISILVVCCILQYYLLNNRRTTTCPNNQQQNRQS